MASSGRSRLSIVISALLITGVASGLKAEDIHGTVIVKQRLTRQKVTAATSLYERGTPVELRSDPREDPLAAERARVVIYLEGQFTSTPATAVMEQKDRRFIPELLVIPVGSTVSVPNLDPIFHNVFSLSKAKSFDLGNYPKGRRHLQEIGRVGAIREFFPGQPPQHLRSRPVW